MDEVLSNKTIYLSIRRGETIPRHRLKLGTEYVDKKLGKRYKDLMLVRIPTIIHRHFVKNCKSLNDSSFAIEVKLSSVGEWSFEKSINRNLGKTMVILFNGIVFERLEINDETPKRSVIITNFKDKESYENSLAILSAGLYATRIEVIYIKD